MSPLLILAGIVAIKALFVIGIIYGIVLLATDNGIDPEPPVEPEQPRKHPKRWLSHSTKH